eukprot:423438_1
MGAGFLTLPEGMTHTGWLIGFVLLVVFALLAQITLHLLMMAARSLKIHKTDLRVSYLTMCEATVPRLKYLVDFSVGITCLGVCCAYLVVIGDFMPDVVSELLNKSASTHDLSNFEAILLSRQLWIVVFLVLFIIPTVRLRKMDALRFTSTAAMKEDKERYERYCVHTEVYVAPINSATDLLLFFKAIPRIVFAYCCHQNAFSVVNELDVLSKKNLNKTVVSSLNVCCLIYMIVAFSGYYSFGESAPSNLLTAYPKSTPILIVRVCLSFAIAFSYPVLAYPARKSFSSLIFGVADATELHWVKYNAITWGIVLVTFGVSMITDDLGIVLDFVGATGTTIIAFILPGLFYYYLPDKVFDYHYKRRYKKYVAVGVVVLGMIIMPFSVTMLFVNP